MRLRRRAFTLIEALGAVFVLTVGIVAVTGALSALTRGESRAREQDFIQTLADRKYDEILATSTDLASSDNGDFEEEGIYGYRWSVDSQDSGIENLYSITVTVEADDATEKSPVGEAAGMVYVPATTTTTGGTQ